MGFDRARQNGAKETMRNIDISECGQIICDGIITLKRLVESDVTEEYVSWLNNPKVSQFLECRFNSHSIASTKRYIAKLAKQDSSELIFGIYIEDGHKHIGNIKIGPINIFHKHAPVGLIIGAISEWGKGYASRSIRLVTEYSISHLGLESLNAGCYSQNIGSCKSFLKAGWKLTGKIISHWCDSSGNRSDELIFSFKKPKEIRLPDCGGITLIGSGMPMYTVATQLRDAGKSVLLIFSPRHYDDLAIAKLRALGCEILVTQDLNSEESALDKLKNFSRLCLCFGPAWILSEQVLEIFGSRIFNFNGIPIPDYLGGAHFTWQILNRDLTGGAYIQQITNKIDRGMVVDFEDYTLPRDCRIPADYYKYNDERAISFLRSFIERHVFQGAPVRESSSQPDWANYSYFPRLSTIKCGWIDWGWLGREIEDFCNAFDDPYSGAMTTVNGRVVTLKKVLLREGKYFHPYCHGLVIYDDIRLIRVAVKGGFLEITLSNIVVAGSDSFPTRGDRLVTPASKLEESFEKVTYNAQGIA